MGSIVTASPQRSLSAGLLPNNAGYPGIGATALVAWKYTGAPFDFDATATNTGNAVVPSYGTVPADAVGVEMWVNGNAADDYLFCTAINSGLAATGVFASNVAANLLAVRSVASGQKLIMPFLAVGATLPSMRVATGKNSARCQGRFISQAANFPYMLASTTADVITGAGAGVQLTYGNPTRYPAGYSAVIVQVVGAGPARMYTDGTAVSATTGDLLPVGTYLLDFARHGVAVTALKFYLPSGTNLVVNALNDA